MFGMESIEYLWGGITTLVLGWIAYDIRNARKDQNSFKEQERRKRQELKEKIDEDYLKKREHKLICENAGFRVTKNITEHFDTKLKEHENELKEFIKKNGNHS